MFHDQPSKTFDCTECAGCLMVAQAASQSTQEALSNNRAVVVAALPARYNPPFLHGIDADCVQLRIFGITLEAVHSQASRNAHCKSNV